MKAKLYLLPLLLFMVTNLQASMWRQLKEKIACMAQRIAPKNPRAATWCKPLLKKSTPHPIAQVNSHSASNAGIQLDPFAYTIAAQSLLQKHRGLNKKSAEEYYEYLQEKADLSSQLQNSKLDTEQACRELNPSRIEFATGMLCLNRPYLRPLSQAYVAFAQTTHELLAHGVRRKLGCYTTSCDLAEWSYWKEMTKVSEAEYSKRLNTLTKQELMRMQVQNASTLAKAVLSKLDNK